MPSKPLSSAATAIARYSSQRTSRSTSGSWTAMRATPADHKEGRQRRARAPIQWLLSGGGGGCPEVLVLGHELAGRERGALRVADHGRAHPWRVERAGEHLGPEFLRALRGGVRIVGPEGHAPMRRRVVG